MPNIINGKEISGNIKDSVKQQVADLKEKGCSVCLGVVIVGDDPASRVYVNNKKKACEYCGIRSEEYALPQQTRQEELLGLIDELNSRKDVNGILVQMPLPRHLDEKSVIERISPDKDVDAFHPVNVGRIMIGDYSLAPCTPAGVMEMLKSCSIEVEGKNCVVIGNEARGLSDECSMLCDVLYKINIYGKAESLNAAVAAGILMYKIIDG